MDNPKMNHTVFGIDITKNKETINNLFFAYVTLILKIISNNFLLVNHMSDSLFGFVVSAFKYDHAIPIDSR